MSRVLFQSLRRQEVGAATTGPTNATSPRAGSFCLPLKCTLDRNEWGGEGGGRKPYPCCHLPKTPSVVPRRRLYRLLYLVFFFFFFLCISQCQSNNSSGEPQRRCQTLSPLSLSPFLPIFVRRSEHLGACGAVTSESAEVLEFELTPFALRRPPLRSACTVCTARTGQNPAPESHSARIRRRTHAAFLLQRGAVWQNTARLQQLVSAHIYIYI